jgi:hypothetical protein
MLPSTQEHNAKQYGNEWNVFILGYQRFYNILQIIRAIRDVIDLPVVVVLDGCKTQQHKKLRDEFVQYVHQKFQGVRVLVGVQNLGCGRGILAGIDSAFHVSGARRAMIMEDDCIPTPQFLNEVLELSESLLTTDLMVSGQNPLFSDTRSDILIDYPLIHGWAISANKWESLTKIIFDEEPYEIKKNIPWSSKAFWNLNMEKVRNGKLDTWDSHFVVASWCQNDPVRLTSAKTVLNVGFESTRIEGGKQYKREHIKTNTVPVNASSYQKESDIDYSKIVAYSLFGITNLRAMRWQTQSLLYRARRMFFSQRRKTKFRRIDSRNLIEV